MDASLITVLAFAGAGVGIAVPVFLAATAVVAIVGPRLTATVEDLEMHTPFGATLAGSVLLGASTSLPGVVVTAVAALRGQVGLAAANAVGGVVAQTAYLAMADLAHRDENLLRKAVSPKVLTQVTVLLLLLGVPLFAASGWPEASVWRVNPASVVLVSVYGVGLRLAHREPAGEGEMPQDAGGVGPSRGRTWGRYAAAVAVVGVAGYVIGTSISPIAESLGLSGIAAGAVITASVTSTPELVTALAATRRGRLRLAVGDIIGGNTFDILFLVVADVVVAGSLYGRLGSSFVLLIAAAILLNAVLLLGFVRRDEGRTAGGESIVVLVVYVVLAFVLVVVPP